MPAPLRIGPLAVPTPVELAPMAGVTNASFRRLCREMAEAALPESLRPSCSGPLPTLDGGLLAPAGLYVTEMVTTRALVERNERTLAMVRTDPAERVRSIQLYGVDPATVGAAVRILVEEDLADHIDLNFGCPVPQVTRTITPRAPAEEICSQLDAHGAQDAIARGERVGAGADGVQAVAQASLQIGGAREAGDHGGACSGDGGACVGAARTHFEAGAVACGCAPAGGGARHGGVKVQDGQQVGFEDARFGEGAFDLHDGGVGEERFAFCVAADVAAEGEGFEVGEGFFVDDVAGGEEREFFVGEAEVCEAFEESAGACEDAVAAACGQAAGEDFEGALTVGCAGGECRLEHGQFVVVGEKGSSSHVFIVVGD